MYAWQQNKEKTYSMLYMHTVHKPQAAYIQKPHHIKMQINEVQSNIISTFYDFIKPPSKQCKTVFPAAKKFKVYYPRQKVFCGVKKQRQR